MTDATDEPQLFAHRGFAGEAPENTVAAARYAAAVGADWIEVDARRCGSGEVVVLHDETVDRVTGASGPVSSFDRAELAALSVLDSGEGVPTLRELFDAVPARVGINVECKEPGLAGDVLAVAEDARNDCLLSSFLPESLRRAREVDPGVTTAFLASHGNDRPVEVAEDLGCACVHPNYRLCLRSVVVGRAHDAGLAVNAWTVRHAAVARLLRWRGVDGVIADYAGVLG